MGIPASIQPLKIPFSVPVAPGKALPRFAYCFLLYGHEAIWLIDAGVAGAEEAIFGAIRQAGRKPEEIELLLLTHSHPDHIGAARAVREASGCRVAAHAAEREWIEDTGRQERERPVPGFTTLVGGPVKVDRLLAEGDRLSLAPGRDLLVLHTPGHSRGSLSFWLPGDRVLISADAVPLPGDLPIYDDVAACVRSLDRLEALEAAVLLSAWDEPRTGGDIPRLFAEARRHLERIHRAVLAAAGDKRTMDMEVCRQVVGALGLPALAANPLVARSFQSHLQAGGSLFS
ncbi:MAG: MBL fold metallo-hydrolase [Desulfobacteraceae bacterium]|nr:MBL fold metallo-hydrolase [Desulfobacteraceae bacterium]